METSSYGKTLSQFNSNNVTGLLPTTIITPFRKLFDENVFPILAGIIFTLSVFGLVANAATIYVIHKSAKLKSIFNDLIMSLCISDLLSALLSPLYLYKETWGFDYWKISEFLCKTYYGAEFATSVVTAGHILAFCFLRFVAITRPHQFNHINVIHGKVCIFVLWAIAIGCGFVPYAMWMKVKEINRNIPSRERSWASCSADLIWLEQAKMYVFFTYTLFFYLPLLAIGVLSFLISMVIHSRRSKRVKNKRANAKNTDATERKRQQKENQAIYQLALIVCSFMVGYIPYTACHLYAGLAKLEAYDEQQFLWRFGIIQHILQRISETLNPVFYNLSSSIMRQETIRIYREMFGCPPPPKPPNESTLNVITKQTKVSTL